jgi:hypothetical protein
MAVVQFKRGEMIRFIAKTGFNVGMDGDNTKIEIDEEILFDGVKAEFRGETHNLPTLKAAVKADWLVPLAQADDIEYHKPSAGIKFRPATPEQGEPDASNVFMEDEQEQYSLEQRRKDMKSGEGAFNRAKSVDASEAQALMSQQDGEIVRKLNTPAKQNTVLDGRTSVAAEEAKAERMIREAQGNKATTDRQVVAEQEGIQFTETKRNVVSEQEGVQFTETSNRKAHEREGVQFDGAEATTSSGGSQSVGGAEDGQVVARVGDGPQVQTEAHLEPDRSVQAPASKAEKLAMARMICPDLPNWDFNAHYKTKIKLLTGWDDPVKIRAIASIESGKMQDQIRKSFPGAFPS